ncbi:flagellar hook-length control protein FliK [Neobacillus sp. PS3-12]|uniref:flagellar hook-length control protein FliK n=1 Tax=Neobacillus sp. PS3-12 TaxID=3070677 RepID=UPI0027E10DDF|nr:flagellar hook-length control protein FliK [Neobacillus sp. PS3-12]WML52002.1 flagellar hook-length control protein FliK [Neobacillus sp. PS3-12]
MEIQGLGNNYFSLSQEKTVQSNELGFQQILNKVVNKNDTKQTSYSNEDNKDIKDAKAVLSFLKKSDIKEITDGQQEVDNQLANSPADRLNIVKKLLGISDQKWSEIVAELEEKTKQNFKGDDPTEIMIEGLTFLTMNPPTEDLKILKMNPTIEGLTDNTILFLKAAKVYSLLSNQDGSVKQLLTGLLESVQNQIKGAVQNDQTQSRNAYLQNDQTQSRNAYLQNDQTQSRNAYLQNTFSQLVSEINEQTTETSQSDRLKSANRLTDWNANNPFLQQMSKPEQLTMMVDGTAKSVSVNDLIQQFESILSKSQFSKMGGMQKLFIKLNPEHLGSISIELIQKGQGITARILTTTEAAKEALESHLHNLKHAFEAQSIKVENVEIGQQSSQGQTDDFLNRGQSDQHQDVPQDKESETDDQEDSSSSFILSLEEAILNQEV